jgi:pimeloyl-ACP methyl ester carboxylesterase
MNVLLIIVAVLIAGLIVLYVFLPGKFVALAVHLMRRSSRLKHKTIEVNGDIWPYLEGGPESADVLVLLHGFGGDKDNWTPYARHFTKAYRVISPDLPGFGDNVKDPDRFYGAAAQTARLSAFLEALGVDGKIHLAGNSMGGYITLDYALTYPERLQSIALFNNAGVLAENKSELQVALERGENLLAMTSMEDLDRLLGFVAYKPMFMPGAFKRVMYEKAVRDQPFLDEVLWSVNDEISSGAMNERLQQVSVTTLIIWGRHDRLVDVSTVDVLSASIPDNHSVVMEETGHVPMLERPKESASHHLRFLEQTRGVGGDRTGSV